MKTATMRLRMFSEAVHKPPRLQQLWVELPDWIDGDHHLAEMLSADDYHFRASEWRDVPIKIEIKSVE